MRRCSATGDENKRAICVFCVYLWLIFRAAASFLEGCSNHSPQDSMFCKSSALDVSLTSTRLNLG